MCGISACLTLPPGHHFHTEALNGYASGLSELDNNYGDDKRRELQNLQDQLRRSLDAIGHRGPDAQGVWASEDGFVGQY